MRKEYLTENRIKTVIVDDEEHCINILREYLANDPRINIVAEVSNSEKAIGQILAIKPDLLLLDIQMPGKSGFEILRSLEQTDIKPIVIFITAFNDFVVQAIRAAAFDYLLKPVDRTELALSIERAITRIRQKEEVRSYNIFLDQNSDKKIKFNTSGGFILVDPKEIIYIQADWNYSEIHIRRDKFEVVVLNIGTIEDILPKKDFIRISRSVIINVKYLEKVTRLKRLCILKKDNDTFTFRIPLRRIRTLEERL